MDKSILLIMITALCFNSVSYSQDKAISNAYPEFRKPSVPPYGLQKVETIIKLTEIKGEVFMNRPISNTDYDSLSLREKFTYAMIHPEKYMQNCSIYVQLFSNGKVFGRLSLGFNENMLSKRQLDFLQANRDTVIKLINELANADHKIGINYKTAIIEINVWEMIPVVIDYYMKEKSDNDVLTTLMLLLKAGSFKDFMETSIYKQLYGEGSNYRSTIDNNKDNENTILKNAKAYYKIKSSELKNAVVYN